MQQHRGGSYVIDPATGEAVLAKPPAKQPTRAERRAIESGVFVKADTVPVAPIKGDEHLTRHPGITIIGIDQGNEAGPLGTEPEATAAQTETDEEPAAPSSARSKPTKRTRASKE